MLSLLKANPNCLSNKDMALILDDKTYLIMWKWGQTISNLHKSLPPFWYSYEVSLVWTRLFY